jgi:hypothetical protein
MTAPWKDSKHTPICTMFESNPKLFQSSLRLFKKHNIQFLSDCISPDGLALLPFREIITRNSDFHPSRIIPKWYFYLRDITAISAGSLRLQPQYTEAQLQLRMHLTDTFDSRRPLDLITIPSRTYRNSFWYASWDFTTDQPIFGRCMKNGPRSVTVQHWVITQPASTSDTSTRYNITPQSSPIFLMECTGCPLHTPLSVSTQGNRTDSRLTNLPCLFQEPHAKVVNLKHLQDGLPKFLRHLTHELGTSLFQILPQIKNSLFLRVVHTPLTSDMTLNLTHTVNPSIGLTFSYDNDIINLSSSPPRYYPFSTLLPHSAIYR